MILSTMSPDDLQVLQLLVGIPSVSYFRHVIIMSLEEREEKRARGIPGRDPQVPCPCREMNGKVFQIRAQRTSETVKVEAKLSPPLRGS